ncbi:MAG TPA: YccF domain-containing protein [Xanthomonadales bacterium]|nr:YccF domain-containing protein [Xanthomonadales bacterium]
MSILLNIIWLILGGFIVVIAYVLGGVLLCITIIGIPFGIQCFKLAGLALSPFGHEIGEVEPPGGALAIIMNIIWIILPGFELALIHLALALILGLTVVGLPLAVQHLKMVRLAILPFGARVREIR